MKAPRVCGYYVDGRSQWALPDQEWLVDQYITRLKSATLIADEVGACSRTVQRWLRKRDIHSRDRKEARDFRTARNIREGGLESKSRIRRRMSDAGLVRQCAWCGQEHDRSLGRKGIIEIHHKDHDPSNNRIENLQYLCYSCNHLEAWLWTSWKLGKLDLAAHGNEIHLTFRKGE